MMLQTFACQKVEVHQLQKFVQLPKSRWTATKDQIVNIPIFDKDIISTIESFPRTLDEAGIVPVQLKRKILPSIFNEDGPEQALAAEKDKRAEKGKTRRRQKRKQGVLDQVNDDNVREHASKKMKFCFENILHERLMY